MTALRAIGEPKPGLALSGYENGRGGGAGSGTKRSRLEFACSGLELPSSKHEAFASALDDEILNVGRRAGCNIRRSGGGFSDSQRISHFEYGREEVVGAVHVLMSTNGDRMRLVVIAAEHQEPNVR